ncbi:YbfB/YjiJ family MFS transporter [Ferruginivarius sediminum]|uniref:YbfB/YjiJ family MFS transporter n=1 Tax=Ferruginivarius sediminum TaxID=2661937 RepID=A0A369TG10_9PROT|nr:YbfB/YjiJ family MFS transporter [Ferruginivarius sediminum]RDD63325.1 YbfB/YjiJ family MFS transporter [Ferruginivarius sediminum]
MDASDRVSAYRIFAGTASVLIGIGLARFAYTPLIPGLVENGWFTGTQAAYLGAANLFGYLLGAFAAHRLSVMAGAGRVVRAGLFVAILSFVACAWPLPFVWFFFWRLLAGIAGAALMVVGPSTILSQAPPRQRAAAGAYVFTGVGLGILLSATIVPALAATGLTATWLSLAGTSLLLTAATWRAWRPTAGGSDNDQGSRAPRAHVQVPLAAIPVILAYGFDAIGFVPHTVFWVDFLARERELGIEAASIQWAVFGTGAALGPFLAGRVVARLGWHVSLSLAYLLKAMAVGLPLVAVSMTATTISSFVVGALVPALVVLTSGRLVELVGPHLQTRIWGWATGVFAAAQAAAGYGLAGLFGLWGSYRPLYEIATVALAVALALALVSPRLAGQRTFSG